MTSPSLFGWHFALDKDALQKVAFAAFVAAALAALGVIQANVPSILAGHQTAQVIAAAVITAAIAALSKKG